MGLQDWSRNYTERGVVHSILGGSSTQMRKTQENVRFRCVRAYMHPFEHISKEFFEQTIGAVGTFGGQKRSQN